MRCDVGGVSDIVANAAVWRLQRLAIAAVVRRAERRFLCHLFRKGRKEPACNTHFLRALCFGMSAHEER